jgi:hypothetical protein
MSTAEIQLDSVYTETLTPEGFLELYAKGLADVRAMRVLPPRLGGKGFGRILIWRKTPIYTARHEWQPDKDE